MYSKFAPKECARCGQIQICTGTVHCPCFVSDLPETILEYIASHYDECICTDCLEELKNKEYPVKGQEHRN